MNWANTLESIQLCCKSREKAADIYVRARLLNGGGDFANTISDDGLRAIVRDLRLAVNEKFLD